MRSLVAVAVLLTAACSSAEPGPRPAPSTAPSSSPEVQPDLQSIRLELEPVAEGLVGPLFLTTAESNGIRYIVEQGGTVRTLDPQDGLLPDPFLDIADRLTAGGEQGLLGLAFDPADPLRFFVNYTDRNGNTVISEFRADSPTAADPGSEKVLLEIEQPYSNHNGGMLGFGPDGFLYVATGDGGSGGDPHGNGQKTDVLLGKILRLDVSEPGRYTSPADNPFGDGPGRDEIWHYGLRNPWRFSFDRGTGDLWIADVGQSSIEEVDLAPAGRGGLNFGWNFREGRGCFLEGACDTEGLVDPVAQYQTGKGCAVTGGYVYRGEAHPALRGIYLYADYCGGQIWGLVAEDARDGKARPRLLLESGLSISSFGEDAAGELYVTDLSGGGVHRIVTT